MRLTSEDVALASAASVLSKLCTTDPVSSFPSIVVVQLPVLSLAAPALALLPALVALEVRASIPPPPPLRELLTLAELLLAALPDTPIVPPLTKFSVFWNCGTS